MNITAMIILERAKKINESIFKREKTKKRWKNQTHDRQRTRMRVKIKKISWSCRPNAYSSLFLQLALNSKEILSCCTDGIQFMKQRLRVRDVFQTTTLDLNTYSFWLY